MGLIVYKTDTKFPQRVTALLEKNGYGVSVDEEFLSKLTRKAGTFAFRVKQGGTLVRVTGREENGEVLFFMTQGNRNPLRWRSCMKLGKKLEVIFVNDGVKLLHEELRKNAQPAVGPYSPEDGRRGHR